MSLSGLTRDPTYRKLQKSLSSSNYYYQKLLSFGGKERAEIQLKQVNGIRELMEIMKREVGLREDEKTDINSLIGRVMEDFRDDATKIATGRTMRKVERGTLGRAKD